MTGTAFEQPYDQWMKTLERRKRNVKMLVRAIIAFVLVSFGMLIQYHRDSDIRTQAGLWQSHVKQSVLAIENMPEPTAEQKAQARRNVRRVR